MSFRDPESAVRFKGGGFRLRLQGRPVQVGQGLYLFLKDVLYPFFKVFLWPAVIT
jgi:hypothetical protein